jgi:hypothetical protein
MMGISPFDPIVSRGIEVTPVCLDIQSGFLVGWHRGDKDGADDSRSL